MPASGTVVIYGVIGVIRFHSARAKSPSAWLGSSEEDLDWYVSVRQGSCSPRWAWPFELVCGALHALSFLSSLLFGVKPGGFDHLLRSFIGDAGNIHAAS